MSFSHNSEAESNHRHITLDDLRDFIKYPPGIEDEETKDYIIQHQETRISQELKQINKCIDLLYEKWNGASCQELFVAFEMSHVNTDDLLMNIQSEIFQKEVTLETEKRLSGNCTISEQTANLENSENEEEVDEEYAENSKNDDDFLGSLKRSKRNSEQPKARTRRPKESTVPIDSSLPVPPGIPADTWAKWSLARRQSYYLMKKNPNAYYYRNTAPGVPYKTGPFTAEEKKLFMKRLEEFNKTDRIITGEWGLFSLGIPGRVGYQCSNYYRKLIEKGEIHDPSYVKDGNGKYHHVSHFKNATSNQKKVFKKEVVSKKPVKIQSLTLFSSSLKSNSLPQTISMYDRWALSNPIPGWIDQITGEEIKVPAISPDGTLLDYKTWLQTLKSSSEDPFTKKPITKRQLTIISCENWDDFKDQIIDKYGCHGSPEMPRIIA